MRPNGLGKRPEAQDRTLPRSRCLVRTLFLYAGLMAVVWVMCPRHLAATPPKSQVLTLPNRTDVPSHNVRVLIWTGEGFAPRPLLVYEPGWNGSADENSILLSSLAAAGFDVVALDIATSQPSSFMATAARLRLPLDLSTSVALERTIAEADWRTGVLAEDVIASLRGLPEAAQAAGLGMLGYSFGGGVAAEVCRRDDRFAACLNMDGWQFGLATVQPGPQPNMLLSGEAFPDRPRLATRPAEVLDELDAAHLRVRMAAVGGLFAQIEGLQHSDFTDRAGGNSSVRALVLAFFSQHLRHQPSHLLASDHPIVGVTLTRFTPANR